jgi:hypothetical protein
MGTDRNCSMDSCENAAAASLAQQALCLDHFLYCCYEHLDCLDPRRDGSGLDSVNLDLTKTFVEECSRKALDVSLQYPNITNLQRGRLLDVLLWAGELFILLRTSSRCFGGSTFPKIGLPPNNWGLASSGEPRKDAGDKATPSGLHCDSAVLR